MERQGTAQGPGAVAGAAAEVLRGRGRAAGPWVVVGDDDVFAVAEGCGRPPAEVLRAGLAAGVVPARYLRNAGAFGLEGQARLLGARATVVGLGGAGGLVAELLARAGVGTLVLVDRDFFEESNLNRQLLADRTTMGRPKAEVAAARLAAVNPFVHVVPRVAALTGETVHDLLRDPPGAAPLARVVVDCLDTGRDRLILQRGCRELGIPLVHGAVSAWRGRVALIMPDGPGLEHFYSEGDVPAPEEVLATGVAPPVPALLASWQAGLALRVLLGDTSAAGTVLAYDLERHQCTAVPFGLARLSAAWWRRKKKPPAVTR